MSAGVRRRGAGVFGISAAGASARARARIAARAPRSSSVGAMGRISVSGGRASTHRAGVRPGGVEGADDLVQHRNIEGLGEVQELLGAWERHGDDGSFRARTGGVLTRRSTAGFSREAEAPASLPARRCARCHEQPSGVRPFSKVAGPRRIRRVEGRAGSLSAAFGRRATPV